MTNNLTPKAQKLIKDFSVVDEEGTVSQDPRLQGFLAKIINGSPRLQTQLNEVAENEKITETPEGRIITPIEQKLLRIQGANMRENGLYNGSLRTLQINNQALDAIEPGSPARTDPNLDYEANLAQTLGHELFHAQTKPLTAKISAAQARAIDQIAQQESGRDYTQVITHKIGNARFSETNAEITGWNTALDYARQKNPDITPEQLAKSLGRESYYDKTTGKLHEGLSFEPDGSLKTSPENMEIINKHFFEKKAFINDTGKLAPDYTNTYGADVLQLIALAEEKHKALHAPGSTPEINFAKAKLDKEQLEATELRLPKGKLDVLDTSNPENPKPTTIQTQADKLFKAAEPPGQTSSADILPTSNLANNSPTVSKPPLEQIIQETLDVSAKARENIASGPSLS